MNLVAPQDMQLGKYYKVAKRHKIHLTHNVYILTPNDDIYFWWERQQPWNKERILIRRSNFRVPGVFKRFKCDQLIEEKTLPLTQEPILIEYNPTEEEIKSWRHELDVLDVQKYYEELNTNVEHDVKQKYTVIAFAAFIIGCSLGIII